MLSDLGLFWLRIQREQAFFASPHSKPVGAEEGISSEAVNQRYPKNKRGLSVTKLCPLSDLLLLIERSLSKF